MKRLGISVLALTALVLAGCSAKETTSNQQTTQTGSVQQSAPKTTVRTPSKSYIESTVLYSGWVLYSENDEGKMVASEEAISGEKINVVALDGVVDQKNAIRKLSNGTEEAFDFIHVDYFGTEYWTRDIFIAVDSTPVLMVATSNIYSEADKLKMTTTKIEAGEIVALKHGSQEDDFVQVVRYNGTPSGKVSYILDGNFSNDPAAVTQQLMVSRINDSIKPVVRAELQEILTSIGK